MADCTRANIPDELYEEHDNGNLLDYLPQKDSDGNVGDITGLMGDISGMSNLNCGLSELYEVTGPSFPMTNTRYDDDVMSWESEVFTIPESPLGLPRMQNWLFYKDVCKDYIPTCGEYTCFIPLDCYYLEETQVNAYDGISHNIGLYASTMQFFFNIYKIYCCIYNEDGEVIDFYYSFYFTVTVNSSKYGFQIINRGYVDFSRPFILTAPTYAFGLGIEL